MCNSPIRTLDLTPFCDLPLLSILVFTSNKIRSVLSSGLQQCKVYDSLEEMDLSENLLKTVSMFLLQPYVKLRVLKLNKNKLRRLTGCLASDMLQELDVSDNRLTSFSLCQWRIPFLTLLSLNSNQLTTLPACLDNLKSLQKLRFQSNWILAIDFIELGWMDNLKLLDLSSNRIRSITLNSSDFPVKLETLIVDRNNMTELNLMFVPAEKLQVQAEYNLIANFNINATSMN
uniref:Leucine rich immune protein (Coil-less) n=1 Tax=Anopheles culicifacies TaxID=139723 RepID=A0A182M7Y1_9DIPT